eukprot:1158279-Pelagomonas_calceolata.AAC.5
MRPAGLIPTQCLTRKTEMQCAPHHVRTRQKQQTRETRMNAQASEGDESAHVSASSMPPTRCPGAATLDDEC